MGTKTEKQRGRDAAANGERDAAVTVELKAVRETFRKIAALTARDIREKAPWTLIPGQIAAVRKDATRELDRKTEEISRRYGIGNNRGWCRRAR